MKEEQDMGDRETAKQFMERMAADGYGRTHTFVVEVEFDSNEEVTAEELMLIVEDRDDSTLTLRKAVGVGGVDYVALADERSARRWQEFVARRHGK